MLMQPFLLGAVISCKIKLAMDLIEFRVWSIEEKEFVDFVVLNGDGSFNHYHGSSLEKDKFIIEQFTGMFDKKGKKIFVGDIIQIDKHNIGYVKFKCGCFIWRDDEPLGAFVPNWEHFIELSDKSQFLIIGNVHENKDLLRA